eukprot:803131-Amphidinium_carterae.1
MWTAVQMKVLIDLADVTDFVELVISSTTQCKRLCTQYACSSPTPCMQNDLLQLRTRPARVRRLSTPHAARSSSRCVCHRIFLHCSLESQVARSHGNAAF